MKIEFVPPRNEERNVVLRLGAQEAKSIQKYIGKTSAHQRMTEFGLTSVESKILSRIYGLLESEYGNLSDE